MVNVNNAKIELFQSPQVAENEIFIILLIN